VGSCNQIGFVTMAIFGPNRWWLWGKDAFVSRPPHKNNVFLYDHSNRILYAHEVKAGMRIQPHEELTQGELR
jgi:hypothetical protein